LRTISAGRSDADGRFRLTGVPRGAQRLYVSRIGYEPYAENLNLREARPYVFEVALSPSTTELPEVVVEAERDEKTQWAAARRKAFPGSFHHLMLAMLADRTEEQGFRLFVRPESPGPAGLSASRGPSTPLLSAQRFPTTTDELLSDGETAGEHVFSGARWRYCTWASGRATPTKRGGQAVSFPGPVVNRTEPTWRSFVIKFVCLFLFQSPHDGIVWALRHAPARMLTGQVRIGITRLP